MAKVLVTGAAGFLGSHLAERLVQLGHDVYGVDNLLGGDKDNIPDGVEFTKADCANPKIAYMPDDIDLVYHCAAAPHEGLSVFSPILITLHTYLSTVTVATQAIRRGVKRLVFTSSMARYGENDLPFTEDMLPMPVDPYGVAKVASEEVLRCLGKAHGMEVVIAVPHNIIGIRQKYDDPFRNVASIMINLMLQGRKPYIYGDGLQTRCFSFVDDCVDPLIKMGFQDGLDGEVFNIGPDDNPITIVDLAKTIAFLLDVDYEADHVLDRPCEVKQAWCSANKARGMLGYDPKTSLVDGLKDMIKWIREKGTKDFHYHLPIEIQSPKLPLTWKKRLF